MARINVKMTDMRKDLKNLAAVVNKIYQVLEGNNNPVPDLPEEIVLPLQTKNDLKKLEEILKEPQIERLFVRIFCNFSALCVDPFGLV